MFNNLRFYYYWTKGEKALRKGDIETAMKCKEKIIKIRRRVL